MRTVIPVRSPDEPLGNRPNWNGTGLIRRARSTRHFGAAPCFRRAGSSRANVPEAALPGTMLEPNSCCYTRSGTARLRLDPHALLFDTGLIWVARGWLIPGVLKCPSSTSSPTLLFRTDSLE